MGRPLRRTLPALAIAAACLVTTGCSGRPVPVGTQPPVRSAAALRDSVGVNTHSVYFDTAYRDWPRVVDALVRLGVHHVRDGLFANPAPQWRAWMARYLHNVDLATAHGIRFDFVAGHPGLPDRAIDLLVRMAATRLRSATGSIEGPNEYDQTRLPGWPAALRSYQQRLYAAVRAQPALKAVPVVGPSFGMDDAGRVGNLSGAMDLGNLHAYTGGRSPSPRLLGQSLAEATPISADKPVYATETGFTNALNTRVAQPPVPEDVAAVYILRTLLENFQAGVRRTYIYELLDEKPDPGNADPEQHFGLLRSDFSPKPAYTALAGLLSLLGPDRAPARLKQLDVQVEALTDVRTLLLERRDGAYVLALWTEAPLWDISSRRRMTAPPVEAKVHLPPGTSAAAFRPTTGAAGRLQPRSRVLRVRVEPDPLVLVLHTSRH
jgi:hypothetical protein